MTRRSLSGQLENLSDLAVAPTGAIPDGQLAIVGDGAGPGPLTYRWSASSVVDADGWTAVRPAAGGKGRWLIAVSGPLLCLNDFGGCRGADDTALLVALDAYIGMTVGVTTITWAGTALTTGFRADHAALWAPKDTAAVQAFGGAAQRRDYLIWLASDTPTIEGVNIIGPRVDFARGAQDPNSYAGPVVPANLLLIRGAEPESYVRITVRGVLVEGGQNGVSVLNAIDVAIDDLTVRYAFANGFVAQSCLPYRRWVVTRLRAYCCGYFGSAVGGGNNPGGIVTRPTERMTFEAEAEACGLLSITRHSKLGVDFVGTDFTGMDIKVRAFNCSFGAMEFKHVGRDSTGLTSPVGLEHNRLDVWYPTCLDQGQALSLPYETAGPTLLPDQYGNLTARVDAAYVPAVAWQPTSEASLGGFSYEQGQFVNCNGITWWALKCGSSGPVTGVSTQLDEFRPVNQGNGLYADGDKVRPVGGAGTSAPTFTLEVFTTTILCATAVGSTVITTGTADPTRLGARLNYPVSGAGVPAGARLIRMQPPTLAPQGSLVPGLIVISAPCIASGATTLTLGPWVTGVSLVSGSAAYSRAPANPCAFETVTGAGSGLQAIVPWSGPDLANALTTTFSYPGAVYGAPTCNFSTKTMTGRLELGSTKIIDLSADPIAAGVTAGFSALGYIVGNVLTISSVQHGRITWPLTVFGGQDLRTIEALTVVTGQISGAPGGPGEYAIDSDQAYASEIRPGQVGGGDAIRGLHVPNGATVISVTPTSIVMSAPATGSGAGVKLTTTGKTGGAGYGVGDVLTLGAPGENGTARSGTWTGDQASVTVTQLNAVGGVSGWKANNAGVVSYSQIPLNPLVPNGDGYARQIPVSGGRGGKDGLGSVCWASPAWGHPTVAEGTMVWSARYPFARVPRRVGAVSVWALTAAVLEVKGRNLNTLAQISPAGSSDQSIRQLTFLNPIGDGLAEFGIHLAGAQNRGAATVDIAVINPCIRVNGAAPAGSSPAGVCISGEGLTVTLELQGGIVEATRSGGVGMRLGPASRIGAITSTLEARIDGGVRLRGDAAALRLVPNENGRALVNLGSATLEVTGSGAPLVADSRARSSLVRVTQVGAVAALANGHDQAGHAVEGSNCIIQTRLCRGYSTSKPTVAGAPGDFFNAESPTAALAGWRFCQAGGWIAFA